MRFLRRWWQRFTAISRWAARPETRSEVDELLARFLTSTSHFARTKGRVKTPAFMPEPDRTVSVVSIGGLSAAIIWEIGDRKVAAPSNRTVRARADLASRDVHAHLTIDADNNPPRHRTITGWPPVDSEQQLLALELANAARLVVR